MCYRAIAPGVLDQDLFHMQTLQHLMKMTRTWDSTMSMIPKGGDTIWGDLDFSPEDGYVPSRRRRNATDEEQILDEDRSEKPESKPKPRRAHYGRIISFGKEIAEVDSSEIERINFRVTFLFFPGLLLKISELFAFFDIVMYIFGIMSKMLQ